MAWKIDEIDRKILELLRESANISNAKLGRKVGLSEPAARRRVANLVSRGVIKRFTVDVEEGGGVSALVFISTTPHVHTQKMISSLSKEPGVGAIWELSGDIDVALTLFAPGIDALNLRIDAIGHMEGISKTRLSVILKKWR